MIFKNVLQMSKKVLGHALGRGMIAYSITFPAGCFIQEYYHKRSLDNINWQKCFRYSCYGAFVSAPMLYGWLRILTTVWPKRSLSTCIQGIIAEQTCFFPTSISLLFFAMALFDNSFDIEIAKTEVKRKFWDSYKVGICYWPIVQAINLTFVPLRNRVVFISMCGLFWVSFLAYVDSHGSVLLPKLEDIEINDPKALKTHA